MKTSLIKSKEEDWRADVRQEDWVLVWIGDVKITRIF